MASENEASCESDPNFAVICGFLEKFSVTCGLTNIDFVELQEMLENTQEVSTELVELHVKLMRRARKSVASNDRWERALIKTCHTFSSQDAWEIERFGYKKARISSKLRILKELLEMQFDYNQKFKNEINKMSAIELRTQPLGRDRLGRAYWYQCDESCQVRVYKDDPDDETWTLVAKNREGLVSLISQLGNGDTTKSSSEPVSNEDSNSVEVEKPTLDTGQSKSSSPKPTQPDASDNMEEEKMDIDTECTETHKNIEENKLEETNPPSLPTNHGEKLEKEKVIESEKGSEEVKPSDSAKEEIKEKPAEVKPPDSAKVEVKEKLEEVKSPDSAKDEIKEKPAEVKPPDSAKVEVKETLVEDEKEDISPENNENTMEENDDDDDDDNLADIEEKLPIEEEPCENALNLCSKDLSNQQESKEEKTGLDLSVKTGPCLRIKPITELMGEPQYSEMQKKEFMGIKGKYIRGDTMDKGLLYPNPTHLGKAVQSASYDAICYKRTMEDDIYSAPTSLKHPRFDKRGCMRPTLLVNKKYTPYMDDEDDDDDDDDLDEDDVEDEIEEPLMLVQGEGSGFPNESANDKIEECPIVGEEIEEPVFYVFAEGNGNDCETGNEYLKESQENKEKEAATDKADTSAKNQLSPSKSYKLGTIIDSKNDKVSPRNILKKSRWDVVENSTENKRNTDDNFLNDTKSDANDAELMDSPKNLSSEGVPSPSPQTFFFGKRSSFSPNSSPNKSASLSFGASTVSDNQNADTNTPSMSASEEADRYDVESSTATFNLDDKTDQNLVGSDPSQTKVPEENVDIENVDNNKDVSERLSVIERNEERDGLEESASTESEHERACAKSVSVTDVSDSKSSEIKQDGGEANSTNASVSSDSSEEFTKLKEATRSDSVDGHVSESESIESNENISTIPGDEESPDESIKVKNRTDTEENQNLTAAVIPKDDALPSSDKSEDSLLVSTSDEPSQVVRSPVSISPTIERSSSIDAEEKVSSSTVLETEPTNTHEECDTSESCNNDVNEVKTKNDVNFLPDSLVKDHEVTDESKTNSSQSTNEDDINPMSEEQENDARLVGSHKKEDHIPSSTTDTKESCKEQSNIIEEEPVGKNSEEDTDAKVAEIVNFNSVDTELVHDHSRDMDEVKERSQNKETKYSNQSSTEGKSNLLDEDKTSDETESVSAIPVDLCNVTSSAEECVENNKVEDNNDLSIEEENKTNDNVDIENSINNKDEITTNDFKADKIDNHESSNEENELPEALISAQNSSRENESKAARTKSSTNSDENEENPCKINSIEENEEVVTLAKSNKEIEDNNEETTEIKSKDVHCEQKICNSIEEKESENLSNSLAPALNKEEVHAVDNDSSKTKNEECKKVVNEKTENTSSEESNNIDEERAKNESSEGKKTASKISKDLEKKKGANEKAKDKSSEESNSIDDEKAENESSEGKNTVSKISKDLDPVVVISIINTKESLADVIENEDDAASKSGIDAIKAIKITSVQAKYNMPDKVIEEESKLHKPNPPLTTGKKEIKTPEPQSLRFLRGRRPNQMLSVKSYATRNKNLVLRKETKPQMETNGKNISKPQKDDVKLHTDDVKPQKDLLNNIDEHLAIVKIEEHVENNVRRSTRRKPADLIEKSPVVPQVKGRQRKMAPSPQEIKHFVEVDVRHSKRLRLSNNQVPPIPDVETIDLTSESESKHNLKRNPLSKKSEEVQLKGRLMVKPMYKESEKDDKKPAKKNGPFLTCVNIKKLKENPLDHVDSPLSVESSGGGDNSDVVIIEDDPLAVPDPYETSNVKPMTLSSFQLDVDYSSPPPTIMTRSLRKRGITEPEVIMPTGGKRRKTKGKRQVDIELRRSIEEQKKQEISSSDEEKKEVSPKRKPQLYKPKKLEAEDDETLSVEPALLVQPVKKPRASKKKTLLGLDIPAAMEEIDMSLGNIRQSRRIAQLKIKEEAERRKIEDITMTEPKESKKKSKKDIDKDYKAEKRKRPKAPPTEEEVTIDIPVVEIEEKKKKRKRKRKHKDPRKIFDESNPWRSSSGSSSSNDDVDEEEDEIVEYSEAESPLFKSDHEFSPESDIEDPGEPQPLKRARTARKEDDIEDDVDEHACQKCGKSDHPEWILLCDTCDSGWHCSCLRPALFIIPEGDWFCPPCQHNSLVKQLEEKLVEYDKKLAKREIEVRRKERLAYVGISLANVLPVKELDEKGRKKGRFGKDDDEDDASVSEESSYTSSDSSSSSDSDEPIYQLRQRRQAHSYRFNDYDDLINSAIQDEMEAVKGAGNQGRGKDISTIVNAEKEELEESKKQELEPLPPVVPVENKELLPAVVPQEHNDSEEEIIKPMKKLLGRKKHRKLNCLDISSGDDPESDEDFKGSSSEEEEEDEFDEDQGSDSSDAYGRRRRGMPVRRSTRARTSRYDKDFINDDSDDDIPRKKKSRSAWEESESEESDKSWGRSSRRKVKKPPVPRKKRSKKSKKHFDDSDEDRSNKKKRRIKYGGLDDDDDEEIGGRRTRGKKINYADVLASDSDEEVKRRAPPRIESDDDYVANDEQEEQDDDEEYEKEQNVEKEKTPEREEIEKEKTPERETSVPKEPEATIPEPQPTNVPSEEPPSEIANPDSPRENFDLDNLNSSLDDLPDDMPDDNDEDDSELNPIEEINKNLEEMDEAEMEKLMEEEEYANKQLQLMAMQLEKEKKRREREAKKKEMAAVGIDSKLPKKRGRKNKQGDGSLSSKVVQIATFQVGPEMHSNEELSEPPGVTIPIFSEIPPSSVDGSPKKRRGRGKGKKTLEKEQAAAAALITSSSSSSMPPSSISSEVSDDQSHIPTTLDAVGTANNGDLSLANAAAMHGAKLAIAAPPQPFSQTQPTPSVITRMMQSQPGQGNFSPLGMGHNYYADQPPSHAENSSTPPVSNSQMSACVPLSGNMNANNNSGQIPTVSQQQYMHGTPPRGMSSAVYRQPPPNMNPYHRTSPAPPIRARNPNPTPPASITPVYHSHHPLDPSPSGGGPITVPTSSMNTPDRSSPVSIPPSSDSPLSNKSDPTPPPPPYSRPPIRFGNVTTTPPMASSPIRQQQSLIPPQHLQQQATPSRNNMPYHPANMAPNYYGGYIPGSMGSEESLPPTGYHYSDQFSETNSPQDMGKVYDEENSGEFGGLVSYFSSQREDDLDT